MTARKPKRPESCPHCREAVTYYTDPEGVWAECAGQLTERAESYASDARKFRDAGKLGQPIVSAEHDARWATSYQVIADELRKVAAGL